MKVTWENRNLKWRHPRGNLPVRANRLKWDLWYRSDARGLGPGLRLARRVRFQSRVNLWARKLRYRLAVQFRT